MNNSKSKRWSLIASVVFTISGMIFLCLSIFTEPKNTIYLSIALGSILIANLLNVFRMRIDKKR